jgi:aspartate racemase
MLPVEHSAGTYIRAMKKIQPHGPYWLAGYSYGGLIAYEMAVQLLSAGESVAFLGLFDTVNPSFPVRQYSLFERAEVYWNAHRRRSLPERVGMFLTRIREGLATRRRVREETLVARSGALSAPHSEIRMLQIRDAHEKAMRIYQPRPLAARLTLLRTTELDDKYEMPEDYGWGRLVSSLEIVKLPGRHLTMFEHPHVAQVASELSCRIGLER